MTALIESLTIEKLVDRAAERFSVISNEFPTRKKLDIVCGPGKTELMVSK